MVEDLPPPPPDFIGEPLEGEEEFFMDWFLLEGFFIGEPFIPLPFVEEDDDFPPFLGVSSNSCSNKCVINFKRTNRRKEQTCELLKCAYGSLPFLLLEDDEGVEDPFKVLLQNLSVVLRLVVSLGAWLLS
jgi:hypothetical protein